MRKLSCENPETLLQQRHPGKQHTGHLAMPGMREHGRPWQADPP